MKPDQEKDSLQVSTGARAKQHASEKRKTPRFPPPLARFVLEKEECLERALRFHGFDESSMEVIDGYRTSVIEGITNPDFYRRYRDCWTEIIGLADARRLHQEYDPKKYETSGAFSEAQRSNAKKLRGKPREEKLDKIGLWMKNRGYAEATDKSSVVDAAMVEFDCGETDVRDAARRAGITRKYGKSTK